MAFLKETYDKFSGKKTTTSSILPFTKLGLMVNIKFRHLVFADESDSLLLDIESRSDSWWFFRTGELIINLNDSKNITLPAHKNYSDVENLGKVTCCESCYYELTKELLYEICESQKLDFKLIGDKGVAVFSGDRFLDYCRKFYNQFYDNTKYTDAKGGNGFFSTLKNILYAIINSK